MGVVSACAAAEPSESLPPQFSLTGRFGYSSLSAPPFWVFLRRLKQRALAFERGFRGKVSLRFAEALKGLETLQSAASAAISFAALTADKDLNSERIQRTKAKVEHFVLTQSERPDPTPRLIVSKSCILTSKDAFATEQNLNVVV